MASSSTDQINRDAAPTRQKKKVAYKFMLPLIYAPVLPLIRIAFRRNPVVRDRLFYGVLVAAFAHGTYIVTDLYDVESK
ncbi:hypothetical protein ZOSMA_17G00850 [Zostera marina]|uniref:Uncharacterized protein n=1 Tax=Zostera marina TaxID=29655 RepID=A0A0K9PTG3_ZOSMR|nr:hypothetical protein ZOSMA_17G00850 [Zostera marina]